MYCTGETEAAHLDTGGSPSLSLSSCFLQFSLCSSLKEPARPPLPLPHLIPCAPHLSFPPLSPPLWLSPPLPHPPLSLFFPSCQQQGYSTLFSVWALSISSPWGFSHLPFCSVSFLSVCSWYSPFLTLPSPLASLSAQSPVLSALFQVFLSHLLFIAYVKLESAASPPAVAPCVCVFH